MKTFYFFLEVNKRKKKGWIKHETCKLWIFTTVQNVLLVQVLHQPPNVGNSRPVCKRMTENIFLMWRRNLGTASYGTEVPTASLSASQCSQEVVRSDYWPSLCPLTNFKCLRVKIDKTKQWKYGNAWFWYWSGDFISANFISVNTFHFALLA